MKKKKNISNTIEGTEDKDYLVGTFNAQSGVFHSSNLISTRIQGLAVPLRWEWGWGHITVDPITVALQEVAEVCEGALLQIDTERSVPSYQLPKSMISNRSKHNESQ